MYDINMGNFLENYSDGVPFPLISLITRQY